jgi:hypothetical protein
MIRRLPSSTVALLLLAAAPPALAHHGTASVGALGVEGPGSAIDTTSPMPLGQGTLFALVKSEYVPFQQRAGFTDQKASSSFNTVALGYGLRRWLSAFVFQPYNLKEQDGVGRNSGLGDTNLMLSASFKWDEGFKLAPEKESLDELVDWHFGVWGSCTLPVGPTTHVDGNGQYFAPDMQTGFRGPSPGVGLSALKQLSPGLTVLAEANYQHFFDQTYAQAGYRYQFGGEMRLNGALAWRSWATETTRVDLVPELSVLNLQRDRTDQGTGLLAPMQASGGTILYGALGARASFGAVSLSVTVKRAIVTSLNEGARQQGSEGLERFRGAVVLGYGMRP